MSIKSIAGDDNADMESLRRYTRRTMRELLIISLISLIVFILAAVYDVMERIVEFSRRHEELEIDEFFTMAIVVLLASVAFAHRRWRDARIIGRTLVERNRDLHLALDEVKTLRGILPICSNCKRIRTETDEWQQMETYVSRHSHAEFTHSLCPECARKLYPSIYGGGRDQK